ncbi:MAG: FAD-dependent monooxygenase [Cellvibrionaceae bacterium]
MNDSRNLAVVIGAGAGGLTAAAALSPFFKEVRVLDKDTLPDSPQIRKGVGQGAHLHSLLLGGSKILEHFFPNILDDLTKAGSNRIRAGVDQQIHEYGTWLPERDLGFDIYTQSRFLLEHVIRSRVAAIPNITISDHIHVDKINLNDDGKVTGVTLHSNMQSKNDNNSNEKSELVSDIVVDCSGRGGKFARQLSKTFEDLGKVDEIQSNIVYASAFIKKPEQWLNHRENILIIAEPDKMAGGALIDIEDNRWCVSLHGRNGLIPPSDLEGWKDFAKNLPNQRIAERLETAEHIEGVYIYKKPLSTWRRIDLAKTLPQNYFPLGDVVNSINPTFGQGMTIAFGHAMALHDAFAQELSSEETQKAYVTEASKHSRKAWRVCAAYDSSFKTDDAKSQKNFEILRSLSLKKQSEAINNPETHLQLFRQAQMLD